MEFSEATGVAEQIAVRPPHSCELKSRTTGTTISVVIVEEIAMCRVRRGLQ